MQKKMGLMVATIAAMGCGHPYAGTREATAEELAEFDRVVSDGDVSQPGVEYLLRASDQDFFDKDGNTVDADTFIKELQERRNDIREFRDTGRIRVLVDDFVTSGSEQDYPAGAIEVNLAGEKRDFAAFDPAYLDTNQVMQRLDYGSIMHEIAHKDWKEIGGSVNHREEMVDAYGTEEGVAVAWEVEDVAYEHSYLYEITDEVYSKDMSSFSSDKDYILEKVIEGELTPEQALENFDGRKYETQEDWLGEAVENIGNNKKYILNFFGWSSETVREALLRTTMYDVAQEHFLELRAELVQDLREYREGAEAKEGLRNEINPTPRRL